MPRNLHKLATWLVVVAHVLSGVAPAQQLVVCVEADGRLALEAAEAGDCGPCDAPGGSSRGAEELQGACPCVDIPLPTQGDEPQLKPKASGVEGSWVPGVAAALLPVLPTVADAERAPLAVDPPGAVARLALIRTVVLRL
jgi:hypothetical protein